MNFFSFYSSTSLNSLYKKDEKENLHVFFLKYTQWHPFYILLIVLVGIWWSSSYDLRPIILHYRLSLLVMLEALPCHWMIRSHWVLRPLFFLWWVTYASAHLIYNFRSCFHIFLMVPLLCLYKGSIISVLKCVFYLLSVES